MLEWANTYGQSLNAALTGVMVLIWFVYLQAFLSHYRRQTRSRILINQSQGEGGDSHCVVCNMGSEPIYLHPIICTIEDQGDTKSAAIRDNQDIARYGLSNLTRQGALSRGDMLDLGSFEDFLKPLDPDFDRPREEDPPRLIVEALALHGPDDLFIGGRRAFLLGKENGQLTLNPETPDTDQIRSRRRRRELYGLLQSHARRDGLAQTVHGPETKGSQ